MGLKILCIKMAIASRLEARRVFRPGRELSGDVVLNSDWLTLFKGFSYYFDWPPTTFRQRWCIKTGCISAIYLKKVIVRKSIKTRYSWAEF